MRSQRRFGGVISKERMESTLNDLIKAGELNAIALLNASDEVVASAGAPIDFHPRGLVRSGEHWDEQKVTLVNFVDLGSNVTQDLQQGTNAAPGLQVTNLTLVVPRSELTNRPPPPPRTNNVAEIATSEGTNTSNTPSGNRPRSGNDRRPRFGRPFGMSEEDYKARIQKQGVHSFVLVMSTDPLRDIRAQDLWLRTVIGLLATVAVLGSGFAWRNQAKTAELQIRLVRASELNLRLKEMNLAAAGLAHETRNPLNIIRGLAQMISKQTDASFEVRAKSREIADEVDRVTAQLNEFINFSKPREVKRAPIAPKAVASEVVRALEGDLEDKGIRLTLPEEELTVEADEQLLRQALFNLLLNSIQAADGNGEIQIVTGKSNAEEAFLEVRDNGPGVPAAQREEIFKPYFTTNQKGTGLGLAVVQQIVLAHGWDIKCLPNEPKGAVFRLSHLKLCTAS